MEFVTADNHLVTESFHGFTDMEIRSALGRGRRKRSHSRESRNSKKTNTSSRSQSRQSENKSPSRKIPKNSDGDLLDLSNNEDDMDATT